MADDFEDLDTFFDPTLSLPIGGKTYKIPSPPGETGLKVQRWYEALFKTAKDRTDADRQVLADAEENNFYAEVLGKELYAELLADGVLWEKIKHVALTAVIWIAASKAAAAKYWARPGKQEETSQSSTTKPSTAEAKKTRRRASTNGTSTPPATTSD